MYQLKDIKNREFENMFTALFATPVSMSGNKENKYVNFVVNPLFVDGNKVITVSQNDIKSEAAKNLKVESLENLILTSPKFEEICNNAIVARSDVQSAIRENSNFGEKYIVAVSALMPRLKPEVQKAMLNDFAKNLMVLKKNNLVSEAAVEFACDNFDNLKNVILANIAEEEGLAY